MRKMYKWLSAFFLIVFSLYVVVSFAVNLKKRKQSEKEVVSLKDSIGRVNFERNYMSQLIDVGLAENNKVYSYDTIKVFEITSNGKQPYPKI